jgi:hypothetical protein
MAEMIFVGVKKDYGDIQSAISDAGSDDVIVIDPGIYKENVVMNRLVHLRGNPNSPEKGEVILHGGNNIPVVFDYLPAQEETIYIEGLQIVRNEASCEKLCLIANSNFDLSIIFNKCRILASSGQYPMAISSGVYTNKVIIEQCYLQRGEAHLSRFTDVYNTYSAMIKTELNDSFVSMLCKDRPNKIDVVRTPTPGYGPGYGSYYKQVPEHSKLFFLWRRLKKRIDSR